MRQTSVLNETLSKKNKKKRFVFTSSCVQEMNEITCKKKNEIIKKDKKNVQTFVEEKMKLDNGTEWHQ